MSARQPHDILAECESSLSIANLIPVGTSSIGGGAVQTADGRALHKFLKIGKDFSSWIKSRIDQYDFNEHVDFVIVDAGPQNRGAGNRGARVEYVLTLDMAKELAMVERNAKGKEARQYFIECERRALSAAPALPNFADPAAAARAWADAVDAKQIAVAKVAQLQHQVAEQAPAVAGLDRIANAAGSMCITDAAKVLQLQPSKLTDLLLVKRWIYHRPGKPGYLAYQDRLQSGNLKHKLGGYPDPDTGDWKVKEQVLVTRKGLTNLAKIIAIDAAEKEMAEATSQHQHHLGLDPE
jgi:anti-repressor protein